MVLGDLESLLIRAVQREDALEEVRPVASSLSLHSRFRRRPSPCRTTQSRT